MIKNFISLDNWVQSAKMHDSIDITLLGIEICFNDEHFPNAFEPIIITDWGIDILSSDEQPWKLNVVCSCEYVRMCVDNGEICLKCLRFDECVQ